VNNFEISIIVVLICVFIFKVIEWWAESKDPIKCLLIVMLVVAFSSMILAPVLKKLNLKPNKQEMKMEQVVCINDDLPRRGIWRGDAVVKGRVYTVRGRCSQDGVLLLEASVGADGLEVGYKPSRFSPVRKTNIEIFRAIDREVFKKKRRTVKQ